MDEMDREQPEHIMQFFAFAHLPAHLQQISAPFSQMADILVATVAPQPRTHRRPSQAARSKGRRRAGEAGEVNAYSVQIFARTSPPVTVIWALSTCRVPSLVPG